MCGCCCCVIFSLFSTMPRDWLGRMSQEWPVLCRVGRETLTQSSMVRDVKVSRLELFEGQNFRLGLRFKTKFEVKILVSSSSFHLVLASFTTTAYYKFIEEKKNVSLLNFSQLNNNNNNNLICMAPECRRLQRRWRTESAKKNWKHA